MTALAEALLAAQRQAIGAASKAFVAGTLNETDLFELLDDIGARDTVEQAQLLASLHALQRFGAGAPTTPNGTRPAARVTAAQRARIEKTAKERNYQLPNFDGLTMAEASEVISTMDDGSYDSARWVVPF